MGQGLERLLGWEQRLADYIASIEEAHFQYGTLDCTIFASDCVKAMTGVDIIGADRGKYHDLETLREYMFTNYGTKDHVLCIINRLRDLGIHQVNPSFAKRGDAVILSQLKENEIIYILGIIHLNGVDVMAMQQDGLGLYPRQMIKRAWSIE